MFNFVNNITLTTSQEQGHCREVRSGGSWRQTCELTYRNLILRPSPVAREHNITKPVADPGITVNEAVVQGKQRLLSGETCLALRPIPYREPWLE